MARRIFSHSRSVFPRCFPPLQSSRSCFSAQPHSSSPVDSWHTPLARLGGATEPVTTHQTSPGDVSSLLHVLRDPSGHVAAAGLATCPTPELLYRASGGRSSATTQGQDHCADSVVADTCAGPPDLGTAVRCAPSQCHPPAWSHSWRGRSTARLAHLGTLGAQSGMHIAWPRGWEGQARLLASSSKSSDGEGSEDSAASEGTGARKRLRKRERFGSYEDDIEEEIQEAALEAVDEQGKPLFEHLYNAREMVDNWIGDPHFFERLAAPPQEGTIPPDLEAFYAERLYEEDEEGAELRWEHRMVLGPGGFAWHPANRKVKVSVYVRELKLTPLARERLLALVGRRYNSNKDELTITSERYPYREENRKDVLKTLLALIEEAKLADELAEADVHVGTAQVAQG